MTKLKNIKNKVVIVIPKEGILRQAFNGWIYKESAKLSATWKEYVFCVIGGEFIFIDRANVNNWF